MKFGDLEKPKIKEEKIDFSTELPLPELQENDYSDLEDRINNFTPTKNKDATIREFAILVEETAESSEAKLLLKKILEIYDTDIDLAIHLLDELNPISHFINPAMWILYTKDKFPNLEFSPDLQEKTFQGMIIEQLVYNYEFDGKILTEGIGLRLLLDFKDPERFNQTENSINIIFLMIQESNNHVWSETFKQEFIDYLQNNFNEKEGSYMMKKYLDLVISEIREEPILIPKDFEENYLFELEPNVLAHIDHIDQKDVIFFTKKEDYNDLRIILDKQNILYGKEIKPNLINLLSKKEEEKILLEHQEILKITNSAILRKAFLEDGLKHNFVLDEKFENEEEIQKLELLIEENTERIDMLNAYYASLIQSEDPDFFDKKANLVKELDENDSILHKFFDQKLDIENILPNRKLNKQEYQDFINFSSYYYRKIIENDFDIDLKDLSLAERFHLISFLKRVPTEQVKNVSEFSKKFDTAGLRTFLSIEYGGPDMGEKILALGEKLPKEIAEKVFDKYGEIIDSTEDINQILNERFGKQEENQEIILKIKENLLKKGKDLLVNSAKNLDKCTDAECVELGRNIEEKLDFISKENILLGSTFKELLKKENLQINEIRDVSVNMINTPEGILKFKDELIRIFKENREDYPEELLKETLAEFIEALNNIEDKEFYMLKNKEDILAFMRFDILENGNYYAGSLNGRNEIQGLAVGGSFLKQLLIDKSKERSIEAVVYEKNQMLNRYANEFGFKIVGEIENYHNTGQKFYKLEIKKGSLF